MTTWDKAGQHQRTWRAPVRTVARAPQRDTRDRSRGADRKCVCHGYNVCPDEVLDANGRVLRQGGELRDQPQLWYVCECTDVELRDVRALHDRHCVARCVCGIVYSDDMDARQCAVHGWRRMSDASYVMPRHRKQHWTWVPGADRYVIRDGAGKLPQHITALLHVPNGDPDLMVVLMAGGKPGATGGSGTP